MDWFQEFTNNKALQDELINFLDTYDVTGLRSALQQYAAQQQTYLCKHKGSISRISINDIYYLQISGHNITIFTAQGIYQKYGSLRQEMEKLAPYGFIQCSQSCIVAKCRITNVRENEIILEDDTRLHISRNFVRKVVMEYALR